MRKVVYLAKSLKPYRIPLFSILQRFDEVDSVFLFDSQPEAEEAALLRETSLRFEVLRTVPIPRLFFVQPRYPRGIPVDLVTKLLRLSPDIIVCPEYSLHTMLAAIYALLSGTKLIIWCSLTEQDERVSYPGQRGLRWLVRKAADGFVCYSYAAIEYLRTRSIPLEKCFHFENCSDVQFFLSSCGEDRSDRKSRSPVNLLYVGALECEKGVWDLFQALSEVLEYQWNLTVVGDGPERDDLKVYAE